MKTFVKRFVLGIGVSVASKEQVLEYIIQKIESKSPKFYVVTPNPELIVMANEAKNYKKILNNAKLALPDGVGVILAGKILGISLKEKITGVDLVENLCRRVAKRPITVSFLGGGPEIAERTAECLKKRHSSLKIKFAGSEVHTFNDLIGSDILFVAFGSPKQELWIAKNLKKLPIRVAIGVGGAFDMISGTVPRAPVFVQNLGFEWLYRLIRQPWRIKRQLSLITFILLVLKEKLA